MPSSKFFSINELSPQQLLILLVALLMMVSSAYLVVILVKERYQANLRTEFQTVLESTTKSIRIWSDEQRQLVRSLAQDKHVLEVTRELLTLPRKQGVLLAAPGQEEMRQAMRSYLQTGIYEGYFIIAPDNISLASSRDANVGTPNLLVRFPTLLAEIWGGETRLTPIQRSDVPLKRGTQVAASGNETMFMATPIKDESGAIIAILTLRINPYTTLFTIMGYGRIGESGDSYAFDQYGTLLSKSRFEEELVHVGILATGQSSASNLRLLDPGFDLTKSNSTRLPSKALPLTRMAASATDRKSGIDLEGYRNFLGVPVVGAWEWDKELGFGFAIEQEVSEAYAVFHFMRLTTIGGTAITTLVLILLAAVFASGKQQIASVKKKLQAIVETAVDGIVVINSKGIIESINPAMEEIFRYSAEQLIGNNVSMLMPEPNNSSHDGYIERYLQTGEVRVMGIGRETEGKRSNGEVFPIELSINRLELDSGLHFAGVIRDISERKRSDQAIIAAREEAEEANRAKSTFLATMSHEIRTPLYGVVGTVDMLEHTQLDGSQMDLVNTAKDSATLLQGIIDDILDFSKIEAGKLELERVPLTLEPLVEKLGENLQHLATKRGVELLIYSDPRLPEVTGDPVRLRQVLYNLAGNAIKFSGDLPDRNGQVTISALLESEENGRAEICLRVSDNGIGMSTEVQKRLFMPFMQGEGETTRRFGGSGLGLVITQRLVEMLDGYIDLASVEGKGSTFSVHLSLEQVADAPKAEVSDLKGVNVVLVNDNEDVAWMLTSYLQHAGAEVIAVTHGEEVADACLEACRDLKEPVVVIDTEGDQELAHPLREKMRNAVKDAELRFVLVERGHRRYVRPHGGDGMTLDLNAMRRATLLNAVAAVVGRESPIQEIAPLKEVIPDITLSVDEAREQGRLILLADDNETNRKLIKQQLQMLGYHAEAASDGKEALELWRDGGYAMLMTDCHMPVMDGYQLAKAVRSEETGEERKPIVAITADALKGTAQKCFAAGMDDYLTKPIELHRLRTMLDKWLPATASGKKAEPETGKTKKEDADEVMDPQALGRLLDTQDSEMLSEYYIDFLETSTPTVEQIRLAFHEGGLPVISSLAHKLKSSARTVGANALADCCLALETAGNKGDAQTVSQQMLRFFRLFDQVHDWIDQYGKAK